MLALTAAREMEIFRPRIRRQTARSRAATAKKSTQGTQAQSRRLRCWALAEPAMSGHDGRVGSWWITRTPDGQRIQPNSLALGSAPRAE